MSDVAPGIAYQTSTVAAVSPVRIVILLYEQLIRDLQRVAAAMRSDHIEDRVQEANHALEVIAQLQGRLDMKNGGDVARNLDRFYSLLRTTLLGLQDSRALPALQQQVQNLLQLREAWIEVERQATLTSAQPSQTNGGADPTEHLSRDWTG